MKRISIRERHDWKEKVEELGFAYHTIDGTYWDESAYYEFNLKQIEELENATAEIWDMYIQAVDYVIENNLFDMFKIPAFMHKHIIDSWENDVPAIYGRFDFSYDGISAPKLLEFNGDTPTSLFETGVIQWNWLEDVFPKKDQFNSVHEKLIEYWKVLKPDLHIGKVHFASVGESVEDYTNTIYMMDTAKQAGLETEWMNIADIGWNGRTFTDNDENTIRNIFKLYPWEWLVHEEFGSFIPQTDTIWIEPSWKLLMSSKAMLPILWSMFPNHPNLLECYFQPKNLVHYAKKPIYSREGNNVTLIENGRQLATTSGEYGDEGFIFQELKKLPDFRGNFPVIGSWIIGQEPAGIGIRECKSLITDNLSRFIPHIIS